MTGFQISDFDTFEVHGCKEFHMPGVPSYTEQVDDDEAKFWTVYGHYSPQSGQQGVEALVDCTDRQSAKTVVGLLLAITELIARSDELTAAIEGTTDQFDGEKGALMDATSAAEKVLKGGAA